MRVEQNISRLRHLLKLYNLSAKELSVEISKGLKNPVTEKDMFSPKIKVSHLKRIDSFFNKGLYYYLDPRDPETSKESSIFFRKDKFNSVLNIGARKIVNEFEEFKISLSAISKLSDLKIDRKIKYYRITDDPKSVAKEIRKILYPTFDKNLKEFLKALIFKFAEYNILIFEFVETWNKKDKANINGFFLNPNVIVLKRQQESFRREIFTLIHELGHLLLNEEEIESFDPVSMYRKNLSEVERWCNDFAYNFLIGDYYNLMESINNADPSNDYESEKIEKISDNTNLSKIALYTRLLFEKKVTQSNYNKIKTDFEENYLTIIRAKEEEKEFNKIRGIKQKGSTPKAIKSPLLISTIATALYEGVITEYEVCKRLKIKPLKLSKYIS